VGAVIWGVVMCGSTILENYVQHKLCNAKGFNKHLLLGVIHV